LNPRRSGCPFIHIHTALTNRDVVATGLTVSGLAPISDAVPRTDSNSSFPSLQEACEVVIAPSRMSLYQSTFGEQRRSIGTLCVDSKRSSHALSLLMGAFYFAHVTARTIGDGYCTITQGDLCFCRVLPYLHNALHVTSGHRNTTANALPGESRNE
jgi:hypothetical protein